MTEAQIKELVSIEFFGMLAALEGFQTTSPKVDEGVDLVMEMPASYLESDDHRRLIWSGSMISIQMKSTTEKQIVRQGEFLKYDLDFINYNDLIFRRNRRIELLSNSAPLILVLLVLPDERNNWVEINLAKNHYCLNGGFYWFYPDEHLDFTKRTSSQRISIPVSNKIDLSFFQNIFTLFFQNNSTW